MGNGRKRLGLSPGKRARKPKDYTEPSTNSGDYKRFTDTASGTHTYNGDGKDVQKFFADNSNVRDLISGMSYEERAAFQDWANGHFMYGQQYRGFSNMSPEDRKRTRIFDKILDQATLNESIVVHRLAGFELINQGSGAHLSLAQMQAMEGRLVTSLGNMSTAAAAEGLTIGSSSKKVDYEFHIPAGSTGAGMWIGEREINRGWVADQREFMTNRDGTFKQGKTTYNPSTGLYTVQMYYVGREKHKYK